MDDDDVVDDSPASTTLLLLIEVVTAAATTTTATLTIPEQLNVDNNFIFIFLLFVIAAIELKYGESVTKKKIRKKLIAVR